MCRPDDNIMKEYPGVDRSIAVYNSRPNYSNLRLLHYRYLNGIDKVKERWVSSNKRLDEAGVTTDIAYQYRHDPDTVLRWFEKLATYAEIIA